MVSASSPPGAPVPEDYLAVNRRSWDERAPVHVGSPDYDVTRLLADPAALSKVVAFDRDRLGPIAGLWGLHLQCHIGTDTLSLARLGATMTGLDFSPAALAEARALAAGAGVDITYVQSDVYQAPQALAHSAFDLVYTGIGALCWLPDIRRWAEVVDALLAPGGRLFVREGHPMLCALDEHEGGYLKVANPYFETVDPYVDDSDRTYVETEVRFEHTRSLSWNHGLGEVVTALLGRGLVITGLVEHDSVPWEALPGLMTRDGAGEWRLASNPERLAASYTLQAVKPTCGP